MERLARWVWRRWRHRIRAAIIIASISLAFVFVGLPGSVGLAVVFGFGFTDTLIVMCAAGGLGFVVASTTFSVISRRYFRVMESWVGGDRSDPGAVRDAAFAYPRALLKNLAAAVGPMALGIAYLFAQLSDESWQVYTVLAIATGLGIAAASVAVTVGSDLLLRPLREEVDSHLPTTLDSLPKGWRARPRLLMGIFSAQLGTTLIAVAAATRFASLEGHLLSVVVVWFGATLLFGVGLAGSLFVTPVLRPIADLVRGAERVTEGEYTQRLPVTSTDEFGELVASFNRMQEGLLERERLHAAFGSYVDPDLAERLLAQGDELFTGEETEVTVFFVDVRDFTAWSERSTARAAVSRLNELFEIVVPVLREHKGHANKFSGDGVLAVFGVPEQITDHADRAVAAAVEIQCRVRERFGEELRIGIGINSGHVIAGTVGGGGKLEFTLIGDPVNVASRVEQLTKDTGDPILLTQATHDALSDRPRGLVPRGSHVVKGKTEPVVVLSLDPFTPR